MSSYQLPTSPTQYRTQIRPSGPDFPREKRFTLRSTQFTADENCSAAYQIGQTVLVKRCLEKGPKHWRAGTVLERVTRPQHVSGKQDEVYRVMLLAYSSAGRKVDISTSSGNVRALPAEEQPVYHQTGKPRRKHVVYSCQDFVLATIPLRNEVEHFKLVPAMYIEQLTEGGHSVVILSGKHEGERYTTKHVHSYV